jgi:hypothetical protein
MTRYSFALSTNNEISQAGVVQSDSFTDALKLLGEQMTVKAGDTLEIGVYGFPPARYECVASLGQGDILWRPSGLMAA